MTELIRLEGVSKEYRRGREAVHALRDVSISFASGEFIAVVGRSGSGKTTLLQLIGCVEKATTGRVSVGGAEVSGMSESALTKLRSRSIGFVFQQFYLLPTLTALENVELPALFAGIPNRAHRARTQLEKVGLAERQGHLPRELSGGEMQRVAIARALVNEPRILLADEPTGNLDSESAEIVLTALRELNAAGQTILMVTHDAEIAAHAHRTIHLRDGRIVSD